MFIVRLHLTTIGIFHNEPTVDDNNSIETMRSLEKEKDLLELGSIANEVNVSLFGNDCIYHEYVYISIQSYSKLSTSDWLDRHMKKAATLVTDNSSEIKFSYASYKKVSVEKLLLLTESLKKISTC